MAVQFVNEAERFAIRSGCASQTSMNQILVRAALFAVLSLILLAVLSVVAFLFLIGMPSGPGGLADFQAQAAQMAPRVDLIVGAIVMLMCGWLAARPFAGHDALKAGLMVGIVYILLDVLIVFLFGDVQQMGIGTTGVSYAVKLAAAAIGGLLAGRTPAALDEAVSLDKE